MKKKEAFLTGSSAIIFGYNLELHFLSLPISLSRYLPIKTTCWCPVPGTERWLNSAIGRLWKTAGWNHRWRTCSYVQKLKKSIFVYNSRNWMAFFIEAVTKYAGNTGFVYSRPWRLQSLASHGGWESDYFPCCGCGYIMDAPPAPLLYLLHPRFTTPSLHLLNFQNLHFARPARWTRWLFWKRYTAVL